LDSGEYSSFKDKDVFEGVLLNGCLKTSFLCSGWDCASVARTRLRDNVPAPSGYGNFKSASIVGNEGRWELYDGSYYAFVTIRVSTALADTVYYKPQAGKAVVLSVYSNEKVNTGKIGSICADIKNDADTDGNFFITAHVLSGANTVLPTQIPKFIPARETKTVCFDANGQSVGITNVEVEACSDNWHGLSCDTGTGSFETVSSGGSGKDQGELNTSSCPADWHLQTKDEPVMILGFIQVGKTTTTQCVPNSTDNTWLIIAGVVIVLLLFAIVFLATKPKATQSRRKRR
jgi:hypothetical protein